MADADDRLTALETRVAHQDQTIEDLNKTVLAQWKRIEELTREISKLRGELETLEASVPAAPVARPPHY